MLQNTLKLERNSEMKGMLNKREDRGVD